MTPLALPTRRVLVVDDHPLVRDALVHTLAAGLAGCDVRGVPSAAEARREIGRWPPYDLALCDHRLPDGDGLALLEEAHRTQPALACVLLSGLEDLPLGHLARQRGLRGFVPKRLEPAAIVAAVQAVLDGQTWFPESPGQGGVLTARQTEVLQHVCAGMSSKAIARELGVSERTVKDHLSVIYARLSVNSRAEAVARAGALGLIALA